MDVRFSLDLKKSLGECVDEGQRLRRRVPLLRPCGHDHPVALYRALWRGASRPRRPQDAGFQSGPGRHRSDMPPAGPLRPARGHRPAAVIVATGNRGDGQLACRLRSSRGLERQRSHRLAARGHARGAAAWQAHRGDGQLACRLRSSRGLERQRSHRLAARGYETPPP